MARPRDRSRVPGESFPEKCHIKYNPHSGRCFALGRHADEAKRGRRLEAGGETLLEAVEVDRPRRVQERLHAGPGCAVALEARNRGGVRGAALDAIAAERDWSTTSGEM